MGNNRGHPPRKGKWLRRILASGLLLVFAGGEIHAAGHGPLWSLSTPVNNKGGWSFDLGYMARDMGAHTAEMSRLMIAYGVTRDFQLSLSGPLGKMDRGMGGMAGWRGMAMMPMTDEIEAMAVYRFNHKDTGVGTRKEDTAFFAVSLPNGGITRPGAFVALAHGDISREVYLWEGIGYKAWAEGGTHPGNQLFYSVALGYRPKAWQLEYPKPDFRLLLELVGELQERGKRDGQTMPNTGGHRLFLAPGFLGTYRNWGFSAGVAFPVLQDLKGNQRKDRTRYGVDVTYFY